MDQPDIQSGGPKQTFVARHVETRKLALRLPLECETDDRKDDGRFPGSLCLGGWW